MAEEDEVPQKRSPTVEEQESPTLPQDSLTSPSISDNEELEVNAPLNNDSALTNNAGLCNGELNVDLLEGLKDLPPWSPARRILTFMGMVCLACTLLVVGIVLLAVYMSHSVAGRPRTPNYKVIFIIPEPRMHQNQAHTIAVLQNSGIKHVQELRKMLTEYRKPRFSSSSGVLCPACSQVEQLDSAEQVIESNCREGANFGYDIGNPCVALVFKSSLGFTPIPFNSSSVPEEIRTEYDPDLVYVTCMTNFALKLRFWPLHGFPVAWFPRNQHHPPPFLMVQFIQPPIRRLVNVTCFLWARNIPRIENDSVVPGKVSFNLLME